jgi:putative spermidine/putrescine transport system substrate-binding protein
MHLKNRISSAQDAGRLPWETALMILTRRQWVRTAGAAALSALLPAAPVRGAAGAGTRTLRVSTFGGYFERMFAEHVYPAFTQATGITVQSIEQPAGAQFLLQLAAANRGGNPPMDVACIIDVDLLRGRAMKLWRTLDAAKMRNLSRLLPNLAPSSATALDSVAAMSWYMTLVVNPDEIKPLPDSWTALWGRYPDAWGVQPGSESVIFEIAANLFFGGNDILMSKPGIDKVIAKIAEIKPNVKLWWQDEGTMQTALINDEVIGGLYFHDTAQTMIRSGTDVRSIFPKEGAVESTNHWCLLSASTKIDEAREFIDYCTSPEAQQLIARFVGSAPVIDWHQTNLSEQEFGQVSSSIKPIYYATQVRFQFTDYMEQQFTKMLTG